MLARLFARRYLFSRQSRSVINVIAGVSILSFAMPVAAMIILLSVLNGFGDFAKAMSSAFDAELTVLPRRGQTFAIDRLDTASLRSVEGVKALSFLLEQQVLLEHDGMQATATLRASIRPMTGSSRSHRPSRRAAGASSTAIWTA